MRASMPLRLVRGEMSMRRSSLVNIILASLAHFISYGDGVEPYLACPLRPPFDFSQNQIRIIGQSTPIADPAHRWFLIETRR